MTGSSTPAHPSGPANSAHSPVDPLAPFTEATREWFRASFGSPTPAQQGAWDAVSAGKNALVVAPTGSGKTLSAFLWSIDQLFKTLQPEAPAQTRVLYISPLKALGADIERNLRSPLVGIAHTQRRLQPESGSDTSRPSEPTEITVGLRTGDTTAKERRDLVRNPPHILITTPESLYLMLTSQARETLTNINTVIVDEVHALAGSKRGAHLALSLERLDALSDTPIQRIGLSATVEPKEEVARFLGGSREVSIVSPPSNKTWDITVSVPVEDLAQPAPFGPDEEPSIWPHIEHRIVELIAEHRSTIVFVNSRRLAEKLTGRLNEIWSEQGNDGELSRAHHGSVSKDHRRLIEEELKSGQLRCVVATSSLELGIDMGAVDMVIQVESPHAVSAGLQRVGRAGHQVGEVSIGWFFPKHRGDLVSTAVVVERMLEGKIEALHIPTNPLDILAQQTIAATAMDVLDVESWFETIRRSAPFTQLPRSAYESVLDLLSGKYPSDRFAELKPRIVWDRDAGTLTGRPGAQRVAVTSGGTIPDRGLFGVYLVGSEENQTVAGSARTGGRRVGELDEEMVYESRTGDVFTLGASSWRIEEITFDRVLVSPAFGQPATLPFWRGDGLGRPAELGRALGGFIRELDASTSAATRLENIGLNQWGQENLLRYLREQKEASGALPTDQTFVVEQTKDELGDWRIILHSPYGLQVHAPWALAIGERLFEQYGHDGAALASDDGVVIRVPMMDQDPPGAELFLFDPEEIEEIIRARVSASALFAGRFREAAARALLLPRHHPGQRTPLWQQRQRSSQLLEVASNFPDFPIIIETMREVLQDVYDIPSLVQLMQQVNERRIKIVEVATAKASPFAASIVFNYIAQYMYDGDSPLAERRAAALSVDPEILGELLGQIELRELLDPAIIDEVERTVQRLSPGRRLVGLEGAADVLRLLGPLSSDELAARLRDPDSDESIEVEEAQAFGEELVRSQRAFLVPMGTPAFAAIEDASRLRDGLGLPIPVGIPHVFLEPVDDPLADLIGRFARTHGPFTAAEVSDALGLSEPVVLRVLENLAGDGTVITGLFKTVTKSVTSSAPEAQWCDAEILRRIRRRSLAALRAQVEPVPPAAYGEFLLEWQGVHPSLAEQPSIPVAEQSSAVLEALVQLSGLSAPASAWESWILPSRVPGFRGSALDEVVASGELIVSGQGALSGHDGWVAFYPAADTVIMPRAEAPEDPASIHSAILGILSRGGAWFAEALFGELSKTDGSLTASAVEDAVWDLFWGGHIAPDSFTPVRRRLHSGSTAHKKQPRPVATRRTSRRSSLQGTINAHRSRIRSSAPAGSGSAHGTYSTYPGFHARWSIPSEESVSPTEAAHTRAEIFLDRYGVVTRGSVMAEQRSIARSDKNSASSPAGANYGGFAAVYKILANAEEAGKVRRGYFIEQLGASQFTHSATIDRLRQLAEQAEDHATNDPGARPRQHKDEATPDIYIIAATDPANAYGAALDWPDIPNVSAKPGRKAGAVVGIWHGELLFYLERGGRTLLLFTSEANLYPALSEALVNALQRAHASKISLEQVNGEPVLSHPLASWLKSAGFRSSPSGLKFDG